MHKLDALGNPNLRETLLFVRGQPRPVAADEVAEALATRRTVARWRLERLAAAGLLVARFERRSGRSGPGAGRPAKTYAPAPETAPIEFPRRRYELLLSLLVNALPRRARGAQLEAVGAAFGRELARAARIRPASTVRTGLERLCRGLGELGFQAALDSVSSQEAVIVSATCPLRPLVLTVPAARELDVGMWHGLVAVAIGDRATPGLVCETENCLDREEPCRIRVRVGSDE
ncbi:MAG: hypothetical protein M3312_00390 [Actinomycetota bacterium]|nr:hypothetical protein [Actinomycetota bacterium]